MGQEKEQEVAEGSRNNGFSPPGEVFAKGVSQITRPREVKVIRSGNSIISVFR